MIIKSDFEKSNLHKLNGMRTCLQTCKSQNIVLYEIRHQNLDFDSAFMIASIGKDSAGINHVLVYLKKRPYFGRKLKKKFGPKSIEIKNLLCKGGFVNILHSIKKKSWLKKFRPISNFTFECNV